MFWVNLDIDMDMLILHIWASHRVLSIDSPITIIWILLSPIKQRVVSVAVVVAFFICWAPFHAQRLIGALYGVGERPSPLVQNVYLVVTYLSGILYYVSTTVNPILYHIMSLKFREAFKVSYEFFIIVISTGLINSFPPRNYTQHKT